MRLLCHSAQNGRLKSVQYLREILWPMDNSIGAEKDKLTPLHHGASQGHGEIVRALIGQDWEINLVQGSETVALLQLAAGKGHLDIIKLFLGRGVSVDAHGLKSLTALHLAAENGNYEIEGFTLCQRSSRSHE